MHSSKLADTQAGASSTHLHHYPMSQPPLEYDGTITSFIAERTRIAQREREREIAARTCLLCCCYSLDKTKSDPISALWDNSVSSLECTHTHILHTSTHAHSLSPLPPKMRLPCRWLQPEMWIRTVSHTHSHCIEWVNKRAMPKPSLIIMSMIVIARCLSSMIACFSGLETHVSTIRDWGTPSRS